MKNWC